MEKVVVKCSDCKKKIRIPNIIGKYRCPACKGIYKYTKLKQLREKGKTILKDGMKLLPLLNKKVDEGIGKIKNLIVKK